MNDWFQTVFILFVCYLIGSIPFGVLVARLKGIDITQQGSRNIGATNVSRVLGRKYGVAVFFLDLCKGLIPTLLAGLAMRQNATTLTADQYGLWFLIALACVAGHIWPAYMRFKGGKGVATALGATLGIYPDLTVPSLICFGVWGVVTLVSRYVSLGSLTAALAFPIAAFLFLRPIVLQQQWPVLLYALLLPAMIIYRHRTNIIRLLNGTEGKLRLAGQEKC